MSDAPTAAAPTDPGPNPEQPAAPTRSGFLLTLVRKLMDFGINLGRALHGNPSTETAAMVKSRFGMHDVRMILGRILHALRLAGELEGRIMKSAGRLDRPPRPHAVRPAPDRPAKAVTREPSLGASLPTVGQIAARLRQKPIGAVIAEICYELGITFGDEPWLEILQAVDSNGSGAIRLMRDVRTRDRRTGFIPPSRLLAMAAGPPLAIAARPP